MGKVPGERRCHHTLNSTPGLTKHPLINKKWGERLNIEPTTGPSPTLPLTPPSGRNLSIRRPPPICSTTQHSFMLGSAPWRAALWQLLAVSPCVCVCVQHTRCAHSMTSFINRSRAVNTSLVVVGDASPCFPSPCSLAAPSVLSLPLLI